MSNSTEIWESLYVKSNEVLKDVKRFISADMAAPGVRSLIKFIDLRIKALRMKHGASPFVTGNLSNRIEYLKDNFPSYLDEAIKQVEQWEVDIRTRNIVGTLPEDFAEIVEYLNVRLNPYFFEPLVIPVKDRVSKQDVMRVSVKASEYIKVYHDFYTDYSAGNNFIEMKQAGLSAVKYLLMAVGSINGFKMKEEKVFGKELKLFDYNDKVVGLFQEILDYLDKRQITIETVGRFNYLVEKIREELLARIDIAIEAAKGSIPEDLEGKLSHFYEWLKVQEQFVASEEGSEETLETIKTVREEFEKVFKVEPKESMRSLNKF
jgi:hypothetical protein